MLFSCHECRTRCFIASGRSGADNDVGVAVSRPTELYCRMLTVRHVHAYKAFIKIKTTVLKQASTLESTVMFLIKDTLGLPGVLTLGYSRVTGTVMNNGVRASDERADEGEV